MNVSTQLAFISLYDHIKEAYIIKFGARRWYDLIDNDQCGADNLMQAVTELAK